jgi:hypothetical protein
MTQKEAAMRTGSRLFIVGFGLLLLSGIPLLLIFLGLGWTWRGMAAFPNLLGFNLKAPISP